MFDKDVVSLRHTRRFARKSRAGANELHTGVSVLNLKTHRCALDIHTSFIISDDVD